MFSTHTAASLGHSEVLGVKDPPRDCSRGSKHLTSVRPPSPWWEERHIFPGQGSKEASEGVVLGAEDARDIFPDDGGGEKSGNRSSGVNCICKPHEFE